MKIYYQHHGSWGLFLINVLRPGEMGWVFATPNVTIADIERNLVVIKESIKSESLS